MPFTFPVGLFANTVSVSTDKYALPSIANKPAAWWLGEDHSLFTFSTNLVIGFDDRTGNGHNWGQVATREPRREIKQGRASLRCIAVHPGDWLSQNWDPVAGQSNWTITGWFHTTNTTSNVGVLSNYDMAGGGFAINTTGTLGTLMFRFMDGATHKWCTLGGVVNDGKWHHYALRFDGTQPVGSRLTWILDGVAQSVGNHINDVPTAIAASANPLLFGRYANSPNADLYFAETLIYHSTLSDAAVSALAARGPWHPVDTAYYFHADETGLLTLSGSEVTELVEGGSGDRVVATSGNGPDYIQDGSLNVLEFKHSGGTQEFMEGDTNSVGRLSSNEDAWVCVVKRLTGYDTEHGFTLTIVPVGLFGGDPLNFQNFHTRFGGDGLLHYQFGRWDTGDISISADLSGAYYVIAGRRKIDGTQSVWVNGGAPIVSGVRTATYTPGTHRINIGRYPGDAYSSSVRLRQYRKLSKAISNSDFDDICSEAAEDVGVIWTPMTG